MEENIVSVVIEKMDLAKPSVIPIVRMMQDDKLGRQLLIGLYENGAAWIPPAGASVLIQYTKPDGTGGVYDSIPGYYSTAWAFNENRLSLGVAPQVTTCPGIVEFSARILFGNKQLSTFTIRIDVQKTPGINISSEDFISVNNLLSASGWDGDKILTTDPNGYVVTQDRYFCIDVSENLNIDFTQKDFTEVNLTDYIDPILLLDAVSKNQLLKLIAKSGNDRIEIFLPDRMEYTTSVSTEHVFAGISPNPYARSYAHFELRIINTDGTYISSLEYQANPMATVVKTVNGVAPNPETGDVSFVAGEGGTVAVDATLTQSGQAADAKAAGDGINEAKTAAGTAQTAAGTAQSAAETAQAAAEAAQETANSAQKAVNDLPISVDASNYTDITGLRQNTGGSVVKNGSTITITSTLQGGVTSTTAITLDEDELITKIVTDGVEAPWTWEGFE